MLDEVDVLGKALNGKVARVAVIGMGRWGKRLIRAFDSMSDVILCCNRSSTDEHTWLQRHFPRVRASHDAREAFQERTVQAVAIATPVNSHAHLVAQAIESGKHIFVEKPLATSVSEAESLVNAARKARLQLFVGHTFLFHPAFDYLSSSTQHDSVQSIHLSWSKLGTFGEDIVWNLVSHEVSIAIALFRQSPDQVTLLETHGAHTSRDSVTLQLGFPDGESCYINVDRCAPFKRKIVKVLARSGKLLVWEGDDLYRLTALPKFERVPLSSEEPLMREVHTFLDAVNRDRPTLGRSRRHRGSDLHRLDVTRERSQGDRHDPRLLRSLDRSTGIAQRPLETARDPRPGHGDRVGAACTGEALPDGQRAACQARRSS